MAFQKASTQAGGQATHDLGRQNAEQCATGRNPGDRALEDPDGEAAFGWDAHGKGDEWAIRCEVRAQQDAGRLNTGIQKGGLETSRRQVDDGNRVTHERQRSPHLLESIGVVADGEMAGLPARGGSQPRQMDGEPLLQLPRCRRGDEGRPRRAGADIDQQAGTIGL